MNCNGINPWFVFLEANNWQVIIETRECIAAQGKGRINGGGFHVTATLTSNGGGWNTQFSARPEGDLCFFVRYCNVRTEHGFRSRFGRFVRELANSIDQKPADP